MASEETVVKFELCHKDAKLPEYSSGGAAGMDFFSVNGGVASAGSSLVCQTGLKPQIPPGYVLLLFSRSGHGFKQDTRLANCVGVIDSDFRGEIKVKLTVDSARSVLQVEKGHKIAQGILFQVPKMVTAEVEKVDETDRGEAGFGSTGL